MESFKVHPDFEVNLFAADPMIAKPIQINFDARGRLWVASSETYPHIVPGAKANDKIIILEDTDGDGAADKRTVFADGLLIPTGVEPDEHPRHTAAYVANSTEMVYHWDSDGDDIADRHRVVLSGFGTEDTHHILHTFRWGFAGSLYMNQSIYIHSHVETPRGVVRLNGGGIWRFRPRDLDLGVYVYGFVNTWGHHFDDWGQQFATDGAYGDGPNYTFPGASYVTAVGASRILRGLAPGNPKHCGLEIVTGRHLPEDWRGSLITNDFRGNRVNRFTITEDGSGFAVRKQEDMLSTSHVAFRPVDVKMGPDGAIYIADWYNPIIQHGEVDFRDERRDHVHGRIWRITAKDRPLVQPPQLHGASTEALLEALKLPEQWTRERAKRVLWHRGTEIVPAVRRWLRNLDANDAGFEHHRLEALWLLQGLDVVEPSLLNTLLESKDHRVRAAAMRVLYYWRPHLPTEDVMSRLAAGVRDEHPRVRLEAVRGLGQMGSAKAAELALEALDKPMDEFLDYALWLTVRELEPQWMSAITGGELDLSDRPAHLAFALNAVGQSGAKALQPLIRALNEGRIPADRQRGVLELIATLGGPGELKAVLDKALADSTPTDLRVALLEKLAETTEQRKARPAGDLSRVTALLDAEATPLRTAAARLLGLWKIDAAREKLTALVDPKTDWRLRQAALESLAVLGGDESRTALSAFAGPEHSHWVRMEAAVALARLDLKAGAAAAAGVLADLPANTDPGGMLRPILNTKEGPDALAAALSGRQVNADVAKLALRTVSSSAREAPQLVQAIMQAGDLTNPKRTMSEAELTAFMNEVEQDGNPARGEQIYRRESLGCMKCHAIGGAGGLVGADMASLGASAPVDYIIESLLQPNAKVKENYHLTVVETDDGQVIAGVLTRRTDDALILRDATDAEIRIPLATVLDTTTGKSLMPEGLVDGLTRRELVDLVAFLSKLGKPGDYNVGQARVVRTWRTLARTLEAQDRLRHHGIETAALDDPAFQWTSAYSTVDGALPVNDAPLVQVYHGGNDGPSHYRFARATIEVTSPGKIGLKLNDATGLLAWAGERKLNVSQGMTLDLPAGTHTITFAIEPGRREPLRVELVDVEGSGAQARVVNGK